MTTVQRKPAPLQTNTTAAAAPVQTPEKPQAAAPVPSSSRTAAVDTPPPPVISEAERGARRAGAAAQEAAIKGTVLTAVNAQAAAANAPKSYDVGTITPDELKGLKSSKSPADRTLAATISRAQTAYADDISKGAKVVASTSAGNGGQPVLTLVPPGFDASKPARVHTHYHGWNATVADAAGHSSGTTARMREVQAKDPQTVFVLPECRNAPPGGGAVQTDWSNVKSQAQTSSDALAAAGITNVGKTVVSAHSGGGEAIANAINSKADGSGLKADRLELQDCFYGSQTSVARWAQTQNGKDASSVLYFHGTNEAGREKAVAAAFGDRFQLLQSKQPHAGEVPVLANGKPAYSADPHNRTVGQYMDSVAGP